MKISCLQSDLKNNLAIANRAVPSRPSHPVLMNVLLIAEHESITLIGFDLSVGILTRFNAKILESGSVTLPAKLLNDIVGKLPEGELTIELDDDEMEENPLVTIKTKSSKFQLRGMSSEEFPELPLIQNKEALILPVKSLQQGLQGSLLAASNDETKQVLTGIHLIGTKNSLEFAGTDGHRLAVVKTYDDQYKENEDKEDNTVNEILDAIEELDVSESEDAIETSELEKDKANFEITIPARALAELEKILNTSKGIESVSLYVDEGQVVFELGERHLTSRKLDGVYPNYNTLIPREFSRTMVLDRKRLITSLERVAVLADQKNNLVKFTLDTEDEQVILAVEAKELGNAKESISAQITGERLDIGFNIKYLMDGLKALPSTDIQFNLNEPTQPVVIKPLNEIDMIYLVMPVQIRE